MLKTTLLLILTPTIFSCSAQSNDAEILVNRTTHQDSINTELDSANINFQIRGHCYAFSSKRHSVPSNGEAHSSNIPGKIDDSFAKNGHYLYLNMNESENNGEGVASHKLYLVNTTSSKIAYSAQDSRLNIIAQAKDENGEWKAISYLPSSWCGNSYHKITLGKNEFWSFYVPVFKGSFTTKLRYVLLDGDENWLVSNEIDVQINLGQFDSEKKQGHSRGGIMDPYDD